MKNNICKRTLTFLTLALAFTACQEKDKTVAGLDDQGFCDQGYVATYNKVVDDTLAVDALYTAGEPNSTVLNSKLNDLKTSCQIMIAAYKGVDCSAQMEDSGESAMVKYENLRPNCEAVFKTFTANKAQGKSTSKPLNGKEARSRIAPAREKEF